VKSGLTVPHDGATFEEEGINRIQSTSKSVFGMDSFSEILQSSMLLWIQVLKQAVNAMRRCKQIVLEGHRQTESSRALEIITRRYFVFML
jgi:hypothetical protein